VIHETQEEKVRHMPGLRPGDPVLEKMIEIVHSPEGIKAALEAADAGTPAMAGIDRLLQKELGSTYSKHDQGPQRAGWEVAKIMRKKHYKPVGRKPCGNDCVCGRATMWVPI
jgi:hypothetical protein